MKPEYSETTKIYKINLKEFKEKFGIPENERILNTVTVQYLDGTEVSSEKDSMEVIRISTKKRNDL